MQKIPKPVLVIGVIGIIAVFLLMGFLQSLFTAGTPSGVADRESESEGTFRQMNGDLLTTPSWEVYRPKVALTDPVRGAKNAAVDIVEYGDFQCPYCADVQSVLEQILETYQGRARLVWKDYPSPLHAEAMHAAIAARCAALQGKFWEYHDYLFANQSQLGSDLYETIAGELGLNREDFTECIETKATAELIGATIDEAQIMEVDGTPHFLINGRRLDYAGTFSDFRTLIEEALREKEKGK